MDILTNIFEFLVFTVIVKGIVAHSIADFIVKMAKRWLHNKPARLAHYEEMLAHHRLRTTAS